ncbi:MAG TPA: hypothetical protein VK060_05920 [Ruania sp.]|nr:hypothetical protein [Ruania sp.]
MHTTTRRTARRLLASAAITITATAGLAGAAQAAGHEPPSGELTGCPDGAVCLYPEDSWNWGNPSHVFFDQGTHRVYYQYDEHRIFNNQDGLGYLELCAGTDGTDCDNLIAPSEYTDINFTDVESIRLFTY